MTMPPVRERSLARGACVISIDTELAWGAAHRRDGSGHIHNFSREREVIDRILELFVRYGISATWAVVGHLFLDRCGRGPDGQAHSDLLRPDYSWLDGDWFDVDPCSDLASAPYYYGRDIVERIARCSVPQEIGSHAFSHVIADDPGCGPEVFASELSASQRVADEQGVDLRSFVYPRNAIAHLDVLAAAGFTSFRGGRPTAPFGGLPPWRRRVALAVDRVRPLAGSAVWPVVAADGLVNVPQTYLFAPTERRSFERLPAAVVARFAIARLRQAARERSVFHVWFHPYNITAAPDRALDVLERVCRGVDREREAERLDVLTMAEVAEQLR